MAIRKLTQQKPAAAGVAVAIPTSSGVNLMRKETFVSGGGLPTGDYCMFFQTMTFTPTDKATGNARGDARLGVMCTAFSIADPGSEPKTQFYSLGSKANKSFMPSADGSTIVPIPGAPPASLYHDTAWDLFLNEGINAGVPENLPNVKALDGIWAHLEQVPEPDSWSRIAATGATAEVQAKPREPGKIAVITQILPGGAPWEGGGGLEKLRAGARPTGQVQTITAKDVGVLVVPATTTAATADTGGDDVLEAADAAIASVLEMPEWEKGCPKSVLRTVAFTYLKANLGDEDATTVFAAVFDSPDVLNAQLGKVGFKVQGLKIVPA